jgi:hypothetical protein
MNSNELRLSFKIHFSDGTIPNDREGFYWRLELGDGDFGPSHGPFKSEEAAQGDAVSFVDAEIRRLAKRDGVKLP